MKTNKIGARTASYIVFSFAALMTILTFFSATREFLYGVFGYAVYAYIPALLLTGALRYSGRRLQVGKGRAALYITLLFAAILCACSSSGVDEPADVPVPEPPSSPIPINISVSQSGIDETRVADNVFEAGDRIGLYVVNRNSSDGSERPLATQGNYIDNALFAYDGMWRPETLLYWLDDKTYTDFYIYYPYTASVADVNNMEFSVAADQSTEAAYKAGDMLMGMAKNIAPTESAVQITARHAMSQMYITIVPGNGFTAESLAAADVKVRINGVRTHASANLATGEVEAVGVTTTVTPYKDGDVYKALIVPQSVGDGNLITVNVDGRDYNMPKAFTFVSGKRHRFTVTLSKTNAGVNVSIDQWEDDGTDNGGTAE